MSITKFTCKNHSLSLLHLSPPCHIWCDWFICTKFVATALENLTKQTIPRVKVNSKWILSQINKYIFKVLPFVKLVNITDIVVFSLSPIMTFKYMLIVDSSNVKGILPLLHLRPSMTTSGTCIPSKFKHPWYYITGCFFPENLDGIYNVSSSLSKL